MKLAQGLILLSKYRTLYTLISYPNPVLVGLTMASFHEYIEFLKDYKKSEARAKMLSIYLGKVDKSAVGLMKNYQTIQAKQRKISQLYSLLNILRST